MFTTHRVFLSLFVLGVFFCSLAACSKNTVAPQLPSEYVLDKIEYFMAEDDFAEEVIIDLPTIEKENPGSLVLEIPYDGEFDNIIKTSLFILDTAGKGIPRDLNFEDFKVQVPGECSDGGRIENDGYLFKLSGTEQQEYIPVWDALLKGYQISPNHRAVFTREIQRTDLTCSFEAQIGDKTTMTMYTVTGKWKGVLHYNRYSVLKEESPLN